VVAGQAADLGGIGRPLHRRTGQAPADGEETSGTGLSRLSGLDASDPQPWPDAHGGGLRTRLAVGAHRYRSVASILENGLDRQPVLPQQAELALPDHANVRGPDYYH
jgi:hypothetical protein